NKLVGIAFNKLGELSPGAIPQAFQVTNKELHRLLLHPFANGLLEFEDGTRATAERPVIEKGHGWVQHPKSILSGVLHQVFSRLSPMAAVRLVKSGTAKSGVASAGKASPVVPRRLLRFSHTVASPSCFAGT